MTAAGPEAGTFLQGQLSQDVVALAPGTSAWSWVLAPNGKVDALVRVTRRSDDEWLLDTDGGWGPALLARLNRFKLRTKVDLELQSWRALGLRGGETVPALEGVTARFDWPTLAGVDVFGQAPEVPDEWPLLSGEDYEAERIVAGVPKLGAELTDKTIPAETGLVGEQAVSFTKGCYTGQELVARIDSRGGHVARHLCVLRLPARVEPATELVDAAGKPAGSVTSVASSSRRGWVGLGYVRRGVEVPGTLHAGTDGPLVEVGDLPGW
ncbi:MAG TPA: hypothetical protein VGL49_08885 [Acidimicrobiales bacterium]